MNRLKPAAEIYFCAGIRRMELGQPLTLGEERAVGARGHLAEVRHCCSSAAKNPQAAGKARIAVSNFFDSGSPSKNVKIWVSA